MRPTSISPEVDAKGIVTLRASGGPTRASCGVTENTSCVKSTSAMVSVALPQKPKAQPVTEPPSLASMKAVDETVKSGVAKAMFVVLKSGKMPEPTAPGRSGAKLTIVPGATGASGRLATARRLADMSNVPISVSYAKVKPIFPEVESVPVAPRMAGSPMIAVTSLSKEKVGETVSLVEKLFRVRAIWGDRPVSRDAMSASVTSPGSAAKLKVESPASAAPPVPKAVIAQSALGIRRSMPPSVCIQPAACSP